MSVKVFFLGRPGSGKTTAARYTVELAQGLGLSACRMKDYDILYRMFKEDVSCDGGKFRAAEYSGFDVLNHVVFDAALVQLEQDVRKVMFSSESRDLITIEFARDDYRTALSNFSADFLQDAYFFFVDADLESCIERIYRRIANLPMPDCHFVSEYIMRTYYYRDNWPAIKKDLQEVSGTFKEVAVVYNDGELEDLYDKVGDFARQVFIREFSDSITANSLKYL